MEYSVIGQRYRSYVSKKDGATRRCVTFYLTYPFIHQNADEFGCGTESVFVILPDSSTEARFREIKNGDVVQLVYNKYGSCVDVIKLKNI